MSTTGNKLIEYLRIPYCEVWGVTCNVDNSQVFLCLKQGASMEEEWRDMSGWKERYKVSNHGKVYSKLYNKIMSPCKAHDGYHRLTLMRNYKQKTMLVHRLVLIAFVGDPPTKKHHANHKDGNKDNNNINNLEWVTPKENQRHAYDTGLNSGLSGEENNNAKLKLSEVVQIRKMLAINYQQKDLAKKFNISQSWVSMIKLGKAWK